MGFDESLADGSAGVELRFPRHVVRKESFPEFAELLDEDTGILWRCSQSPFRIDVGAERDGLLLQQMERASRHVFDRIWDARHPSDADPSERRTMDTGWSPLVGLARMEIAGAAALRVVHRIAYESEYEHLVAKLMIPVRHGTVEIAAHAVDTLTGVRESTLSVKRTPEEMLAHPGQPFFDDPSHDGAFPDHALSRVRAAERWLLHDSGLRVLRPDALVPSGLVALEAARCALVPPPRHLELPAGSLGMPGGMVNFARVDLDVADPALFEVWHVDDAGVPPGDADALGEVAKLSARGWAEEGAEDVSTCVRTVSVGELIDVDCDVTFEAGGRAITSVQRWVGDAEGRVWRLALSGDAPLVPVDEARGQLEAVRSTFRTMPPAA